MVVLIVCVDHRTEGATGVYFCGDMYVYLGSVCSSELDKDA